MGLAHGFWIQTWLPRVAGADRPVLGRARWRYWYWNLRRNSPAGSSGMRLSHWSAACWASRSWGVRSSASAAALSVCSVGLCRLARLGRLLPIVLRRLVVLGLLRRWVLGLAASWAACSVPSCWPWVPCPVPRRRPAGPGRQAAGPGPGPAGLARQLLVLALGLLVLPAWLLVLPACWSCPPACWSLPGRAILPGLLWSFSPACWSLPPACWSFWSCGDWSPDWAWSCFCSCLLLLPQQFFDLGPIVQGILHPRLARQGLVVGGDGLLELACLGQGVALVVVPVGAIGGGKGLRRGRVVLEPVAGGPELVRGRAPGPGPVRVPPGRGRRRPVGPVAATDPPRSGPGPDRGPGRPGSGSGPGWGRAANRGGRRSPPGAAGPGRSRAPAPASARAGCRRRCARDRSDPSGGAGSGRGRRRPGSGWRSPRRRPGPGPGARVRRAVAMTGLPSASRAPGTGAPSAGPHPQDRDPVPLGGRAPAAVRARSSPGSSLTRMTSPSLDPTAARSSPALASPRSGRLPRTGMIWGERASSMASSVSASSLRGATTKASPAKATRPTWPSPLALRISATL